MAGSMLGGGAVFRSRFPYGKEPSQLQGSVPVLCSTGPREQGATRTDQSLVAGNRPRKRRFPFSLSSPPLLPSPLLSPPALCPWAQAAEKPSRPSCAEIRMFLGDRQISGLACVQRNRGLVMLIDTLERDSVRD